MRPFYKIFNELIIRILIFSMCLFSSIGFSAETKDPIDLQKSFEKIKLAYEKEIQNTNDFSQRLELIDAKQQDVSALDIKLDECISKITNTLKIINENLKPLGEESKNEEDRDIKSKRKELNDQLQAVDNELKRCSLTKIQLKEFSEAITKKRLNFLKQQLLSKETSVYSAAASLLKKEDKKSTTNSDNKPFSTLFDTFKASLTWKGYAFVLFGIFVGWFWQRKESNEEFDHQQLASPIFNSILRGLQRTAPILVGLTFLWIAIRFSESQEDALLPVVRFALYLTFAFATFRGLLFPRKSIASEMGVPRYKLLMLVFFAIVFSTIAFMLNEHSLGRFSDSTLLFFVWFGSMVISAVSFILILHYVIKNISKKSRKSFYLYIPMVFMAAMLVTAFLGYRNLSSLVFFGMLMSMITILIMLLLIRISSEVFDSLDQGKIPWQAKVRSVMSVEDNHAFPGVLWFRMLVFFATLFTGISALITIWGGPQQHISSLKGVLQNGLKIGSVQLDIANIILAILVMVVTLSMLPFIKNKLISGWLKHSNLSSGAKDATQTLVGYVVVGIAFLWALFILGMNFQNLAIIAGALSVGIGFGLQNIVNNFVSGLILLFERPIRRGDWIVVGSTEGYVRDISIRSTTIQTFDKADVIVPNSELISNQVTNWMLSSNIGRLKAAVGVAYGSDVNKVREVLKKIADDNPEVISNNSAYPTRVLFMAFGDSSLNFEIRCFVRDVENRINIQSDINLSIDAAFREHNIEIPFPQRVVHMQDSNND